MKILHVTSSLDPKGGGPPGVVRNLAVEQRLAGNQMEVATLDAPGSAWLSDFPCPTHALGPTQFKYRYTPKLVPWLKEHCAKFDAVIVNGIWQYNSFGTWRALHGGNIPYFVFTHGMLDPWFKDAYPMKHFKKCLYWPWAEYRVLRDAAAVMFTSEEEKASAPRSFWMSKWKGVVVNYGTAPPVGDPDAQKQLFHDRFPDLYGKRLLLFLSRIHPKKGCDLLIDAFASLAAQHPDFRLVLAGPDQVGWKKELTDRAQHLGIGDRITWAGMLAGDLKWGALYTSDVFILPSHQENFGIVVAEALACGLPVLISNKVNIWHDIATDKAGIIADDTIDGTREMLAKWFMMPDSEKALMRSRASQCFQNRFHIRNTVASIVETIQRSSHAKHG